MEQYIHLIVFSGLFLGFCRSSLTSDDIPRLQKHQIMSRQIMNRRAYDNQCIYMEKCELMNYDDEQDPICVRVCVQKGNKRSLDIRQIMNRNIHMEGGMEDGCRKKCVKLVDSDSPVCIDLCIDSGKRRFVRQIMSRRRQIMHDNIPDANCTWKCVSNSGLPKTVCLQLCLSNSQT